MVVVSEVPVFVGLEPAVTPPAPGQPETYAGLEGLPELLVVVAVVARALAVALCHVAHACSSPFA
jgi:hypothetical protein